MNIPWEDVETFLAVAEARSFSGAARALGVTQPTVSRRIGALEERLSRALFRRDVEGAHLTDDGAKLQPAAVQMARFANELGQIATNFDERPTGVVRIAVPPGMAFEAIVPFAAALRDRLSDIQIHAIAGIEYLDLSRGMAELAIRSRPPSSPDLMVLAHYQVELGVFASESYVQGAGQCLAPRDVDWVCWAYPNEHLEPMPSLRKLIPDFTPVFASNDYIVQTRAVAEGLGAMILPRRFHARQPYARFVELDVGLALPPADIYVVCAKTMRWVPRIRAVAAELVDEMTATKGMKRIDD